MSTFNGGIHPLYNKLTSSKAIVKAELPKVVILPLSQHIGKPAKEIVNVGDTLKVGQKIAEADGFVSSSIFATISGTVKEIVDKPGPLGNNVRSIVIESDGKDEWVELQKRDNIDPLSVDDLKNMIKEAGIVGLGGAAFPTHVKLSPPKDKNIDCFIINGAECEPYLTCDDRLMQEKASELLKGIQIIKKILGVKEAIIGVEDNKKEAIEILSNKIKMDKQEGIKVQTVHTKYPQGAEKMLIYSLTKRKVPAGGLPMDAGCVVQNIGTCIAVQEAVYDGKPLVERCVTVTGSVNKPTNLMLRIGTQFKDIIQQAGGIKGRAGKIINGGPMMGITQSTMDVPVVKGTSGILVLDNKSIDFGEQRDCIRCARCVDQCPMNLLPNLIARYTSNGLIDEAEKFYPMDCFECGCCSYSCPSKIPLLHHIRVAKSELMKKKKK